MRCDAAQRALSAAMDGDRPNDEAARHANGCVRCTAFQLGAQRVRASLRVQAAETVPDLTADIMRAIATEPRPSSAADPLEPIRLRSERRRPAWAGLAAAAVAGLIIGYVGMSGLNGGPRVADAVDVANEVRLASGDVDSYQAEYDVTEFGSAPDGGDRSLDLSVAYASPERFRLQVTESTPGVAPADGDLRVDGDSWWIEGGRICPRVEECRGGAQGVLGTKLVTGRAPFDPGEPMPTDIVLPLSSLSGTDALRVFPEIQRDGVRTVDVELAAADAEPLLAAIQQVGRWRPIYGQDRVHVRLDADRWIPRSIEVRSVGGADRAAWSARLGLPLAPAGEELLRADLRSLRFDAPDPSVFEPGSSDVAVDEGFMDIPVEDIAAVAGVVLPDDTAGLRPWRAGRFEDGDAVVVSYADGLRWMRLFLSPTVARPDPISQEVAFGDGVGYYQPSSDGDPRRITIVTSDGSIVLEGNLTREELIDAAESLPVTGETAPGRHMVDVSSLPRDVGQPVLIPGLVPPGTELIVTSVDTANSAVELVYAHPERESAGYALRVYQAPARTLPPAPESDLISARVRDITGRWSPSRHELEWIEDGVYHSLRAPSESLGVVLRIAQEMEETR